MIPAALLGSAVALHEMIPIWRDRELELEVTKYEPRQRRTEIQILQAIAMFSQIKSLKAGLLIEDQWFETGTQSR